MPAPASESITQCFNLPAVLSHPINHTKHLWCLKCQSKRTCLEKKAKNKFEIPLSQACVPPDPRRLCVVQRECQQCKTGRNGVALSLLFHTQAHTHARACAHTHTRTRTHASAHTHTQIIIYMYIYCVNDVSEVHCVAVRCSALQCVAVHFCVLRCVVVYCNVL